MRRRNGSQRDDLTIEQIETALGALPAVTPRPGFRNALRDTLATRAQETITPLASRRSRREAQRRTIGWRPAFAMTAVAAAILVAALLLPGAYDRYQTARLPKLPAAVVEFIGAGGRYSPVKEATYTLNAQLPAAPRKVPVYGVKLSQYTLSEAQQLAAAWDFRAAVFDANIEWRAEDTPTPGASWLGRLLEVDKGEARVAYNDYRAVSGGQVSSAAAEGAARAFLTAGKLPFASDAVTVTDLADRPQYEVQFYQRLGGYDALGLQSHVWVNKQGGAVASAYFVRASFPKGKDYPIKTAAQAFEDLKTQTVYAENEKIAVTINAVRLAYYGFPRMNLPTEQMMMQPVWVFTGVDNYGQPFETNVPAVPAELRMTK